MPQAVGGIKLCTKCRESKPVAEFPKNAQTRDGLYTWCSSCSRAKSIAYRNAHRAQAIANAKAWKEANPERVRENHQRFLANNPGKASEYSRRYRDKYPERYKAQRRAGHFRRKFGITVEEYDHRFDAQKGGCAICGAPPTEDRLLCIDHCHTNGHVRGLLCSNCNTALGLMGDDPQRLRAAANYLKRTG